MKKTLVALLTVAVSTSFGCANKPEPSVAIPPDNRPTTMCAPDWAFATPKSKDGFYQIGKAQFNSATMAQDAADAAARQAVANTLETKTAGMVQTFEEESGFGENAVGSKFGQTLKKTVVAKNLYNVAIEQRYACPDGTWYSLAFCPTEMFAEYVVETAKATPVETAEDRSVKDAFLAREALDQLQDQIDRAFGD